MFAASMAIHQFDPGKYRGSFDGNTNEYDRARILRAPRRGTHTPPTHHIHPTTKPHTPTTPQQQGSQVSDGL